VLAFSLLLASCSNGSTGDGDGNNNNNNTTTGQALIYAGVSGTDTYVLTITETAARAAKTGDAYVLFIIAGSSTKESSGTVTVNEDGTLTLSNGGVVTVSGGSITAITGTINTYYGENLIAPSGPLSQVAINNAALNGTWAYNNDVYDETVKFNNGSYEWSNTSEPDKGTYNAYGNTSGAIIYIPTQIYISTLYTLFIEENWFFSISAGWYTKAQFAAKSPNPDWKEEVEWWFKPYTDTYSISGNKLNFGVYAEYTKQ
jgi:hypothetical protein